MNLDAQTFFSLLMNGLASGSMLFIVACGLSLIFGVTQIVNFAHGSFYMLGAYVRRCTRGARRHTLRLGQ